MNHHILNQIHEEINSCPFLKNGNIKCGRDEKAAPKIVDVRDTQRILLITTKPSNEANELEDITNFGDSYLSDKLLPILFADYEVSKAKENEVYFENFRKEFLNIIYWTHYQKCYSKAKAKECAEKYLTREIEAFEPDLIICVGKIAVNFTTKEKELVTSISKNGNNYSNFAGKNVPIISLTDPSNSNNKAKGDPRYRFEETINLIQQTVESFRTE